MRLDKDAAKKNLLLDRELYTYENGVLRNNFGIMDAEKLREVERKNSRYVSARLLKAKLPDVSLRVMLDIHRKLFSRVYPWAGNVREVNISKGRTTFADAEMVAFGCDSILSSIYSVEHNGYKMSPKEEFCRGIGTAFNMLNDIHPFREGNGRTLRMVVYHIAKNAGWLLDLSKCNREEYMAASIAGCNGYHDGMIHLMQKNIQPFPDGRVARNVRMEREKLLAQQPQQQQSQMSSRRREAYGRV